MNLNSSIKHPSGGPFEGGKRRHETGGQGRTTAALTRAGVSAAAVIFFAFVLAASSGAEAAEKSCVLDVSRAATRSVRDIESFFAANGIPGEYLKQALREDGGDIDKGAGGRGIIYYRIDYGIQLPGGSIVKASGLLALPLGPWRPSREIKLVSYQHGTLFDDRDAPSRPGSCPEAEAVACVFVPRGFAVAMADYRGLGPHAGFHPYFHAESAAEDCDNFLKAAVEFMGSLGLRAAGGKVYLAGFSQGGHAALALQRRLEGPAGPAGGLVPAANAVIAGACDPYLLFNSWRLRPNPIAGAVMGRILESYSRIYGAGRTEGSGLFKPPYDLLMADIADNGFTPAKIMKTPARLDALLAEDFYPGAGGRGKVLMESLESNEVYKNWSAKAPVNFYHGGADTIVAPVMSKIACDRMKMNGAEAGLINAGETLDHAGSIIPSCLMARDWFESL